MDDSSEGVSHDVAVSRDVVRQGPLAFHTIAVRRELTPRQIVQELECSIVDQGEAKRAAAQVIWIRRRCQQLPGRIGPAVRVQKHPLDAAYVRNRLSDVWEKEDLSKFIL